MVYVRWIEMQGVLCLYHIKRISNVFAWREAFDPLMCLLFIWRVFIDILILGFFGRSLGTKFFNIVSVVFPTVIDAMLVAIVLKE